MKTKNGFGEVLVELYTGSAVQQIVESWRPQGQLSICERFCSKFGDEACPHHGGSLPEAGLCDGFAFKSPDDLEQANRLFIEDAAQHGYQI